MTDRELGRCPLCGLQITEADVRLSEASKRPDGKWVHAYYCEGEESQPGWLP